MEPICGYIPVMIPFYSQPMLTSGIRRVSSGIIHPLGAPGCSAASHWHWRDWFGSPVAVVGLQWLWLVKGLLVEW